MGLAIELITVATIASVDRHLADTGLLSRPVDVPRDAVDSGPLPPSHFVPVERPPRVSS